MKHLPPTILARTRVEVTVYVPDESGGGHGLLVRDVAVTVAGEAVAPAGSVTCGALVGGTFDALLSDPVAEPVQHRVVVGLRHANGLPAGTPVEINELAGVPPQPPVWVEGAGIPQGLRVPIAPGEYVLWAEDWLDAPEPREAFASAIHTNETALARVLGSLVAAAPGEDDACVRLGTVAERAGRTVDVPITVSAMGGENAFTFSLVYDATKLQLLTFKPGATLSGFHTQLNDGTAGQVGVLMMLPLDTGLEPGMQELATAKFRIQESVAAGQQLPVSFGDEPAFRMVVDADANPLPHLWHDGGVTVAPPGYEADVGPRGKPDDIVDDKDKKQVMRFVIKLDTPTAGDEFQRADCAPIDTRGDGRIDIRDAVVATRYADGAEPLKAAGGPTGPLAAAQTSLLSRYPSSSKPLTASFERSMAMGLVGLLRLDASFGLRGEVLEVPVAIVSGGNVEGVSFSVTFDPDQLVLLDAVPSPACSQAMTVLNGESACAGVLGYALRMPPGGALPAGSTQILTLRFRVAPAAGDAVTQIDFASAPTAVALSDRNGGTVGASVQSACVYLLPVVPEGAPESVDDLAAAAEAGTRVKLSWGDVTGETGYTLHRRSERQTWGLLAELPADARGYVDDGLEPGMTYTYRIAAANAVGESWSDSVAVAVPTRYRYWADTRTGLLLGDPRDDQDKDGRNNYLEYLMGSDPTLPEQGLLRTVFADLYGLGDDYLTLSLEVHDWAQPLLDVGTAEALDEGLWEPAAEVENDVADGRRRLTYRSARPVSAVPAQFIRIQAVE